MITIVLSKVQIEGEDQDLQGLHKGPWEFNSRDHMETQLEITARECGGVEIRVGYPPDGTFVFVVDEYLAAEYTLKES